MSQFWSPFLLTFRYNACILPFPFLFGYYWFRSGVPHSVGRFGNNLRWLAIIIIILTFLLGTHHRVMSCHSLLDSFLMLGIGLNSNSTRSLDYHLTPDMTWWLFILLDWRTITILYYISVQLLIYLLTHLCLYSIFGYIIYCHYLNIFFFFNLGYCSLWIHLFLTLEKLGN